MTRKQRAEELRQMAIQAAVNLRADKAHELMLKSNLINSMTDEQYRIKFPSSFTTYNEGGIV